MSQLRGKKYCLICFVQLDVQIFSRYLHTVEELKLDTM